MKRLVCHGIMLAAGVLLIGCVPITYTKQVTTKMDGAGKVTEVVIVETITEPHSESERIESPKSGAVKLKNIEK